MFVFGMLGGFILAAAIFLGTDARWDRRKTSLSRTPLSIQTLLAGDSGKEFSGVRS